MAGLEGDLDIPKVGKLPKKVAVPLAVGLVAFVGWRFWMARGGTGDDGGEGGSITDGEFGAVDQAVPDTLNPFPGSFSGGGSPAAGGSTTTGDRDGDGVIGPGEFTNNGQWTDYVVGKLSAADNWAYSEIVTALGNGLAGRPTTSVQQDILRAALAVGGQPPSGSLTVVTGGNTALTVAPTGVAVASVTDTSAAISFTPVSGATSYVAYRGGESSPVGAASASPIRLSGLKSATSYSVQVAGVSAAGTPGPKSAAVTVKTAAAASAAAISGRVSTPQKTAIYTTFKPAAGATAYRIWINGKQWRDIPGAPVTIGPLTPNTRYTIGIAAVNRDGKSGPVSNATVRTKK